MERNTLLDGVRLTVTGRQAPATRLLVAAGRRMLLRQGDRDVLLARVLRDHCGVDVLRLPGWTSPLPPIRFAEARDLAGDPSRWAHRFAPLLEEFLHDGEWLLSWRELPPYTLAGDLVRDYPACDLDWFCGWHGALPLRRLSDMDGMDGAGGGRVKAYRKLALDGTLPPIVLWWQSGFDGYFVIDGHDRLVAASDAGVTPPTLVLSTAGTGAWLPGATAQHEEAIRHIDAEVAKGTPGALTAREAQVRHFAELATAVPSESGRSVAWPLPGGAAEWDRIAAVAGFVT